VKRESITQQTEQGYKQRKLKLYDKLTLANNLHEYFADEMPANNSRIQPSTSV
jgi:hypothetical protein